MRLARLIPLFALLITGCVTNSKQTLTPTGIVPFEENPSGMLPGIIDPVSTPATMIEPTEVADWQEITMPTIGWTLQIPASWSAEQIDTERYEIRDAEGRVLITAGIAGGLGYLPEDGREVITEYLQAEGLESTQFQVTTEVVENLAYIRVNGDAVDACAYWYLPVLGVYPVLKFDRSLCTEVGDLNELAFAILRGVSYTGTTE